MADTVRLILIADDLTGTLDAAAPFAGRGLSVSVALTPDALPELLAGPSEVIAVNTHSRELPESRAVDLMTQLCRMLPAKAQLFKKVDSRLKGHIRAELSVLSPERILMAPAIPAFNRLVQDGSVCGFGVEVPLPVAPVLGDLAACAEIPDTRSMADLIALLAPPTPSRLLVGARGLAEALAIVMTGKALADPVDLQLRNLLVIVGSRDPITLAQVQSLRRSPQVDWHAAVQGRLPEPVQCRPAGITLVQAVEGPSQMTGEAVATALAQSIHPALTRQADGLFMTGGATAEALLAAMGVRQLTLLGEVFPGVPLAMRDQTAIITKSGGFGTSELLANLESRLSL